MACNLLPKHLCFLAQPIYTSVTDISICLMFIATECLQLSGDRIGLLLFRQYVATVAGGKLTLAWLKSFGALILATWVKQVGEMLTNQEAPE